MALGGVMATYAVGGPESVEWLLAFPVWLRLEFPQLAPPERVIAPPTLVLTYERNKGLMP